MNFNSRYILRSTALYLGAMAILSAVLLYPAFINGFPLLTSDSGAYIMSAHTLEVPADRPIFYSIFIRIFDFGHSFWPVLLVQCLLVSALVFRLLQNIFPKKKFAFKISIGLLGVLCSAMPWVCSQLMPDVFILVILLALANFYLEEKTNYLMLAIVVGACCVHYSFLLIVSTLVVGMAIFMRSAHARKRIFPVVASLLPWVIVIWSNVRGGHGTVVSPSSHVFLVSKMYENGILKKYVEKRCAKEKLKLCAYSTELQGAHSWDFMWEANSPLYKTDGWKDVDGEYKGIVSGSLKDPEFLRMHMAEGISSTWQQLRMNSAGDGMDPFDSAASPRQWMGAYYPQQLQNYLSSKQQAGTIKESIPNGFYELAMLLATLFLLYAMFRHFRSGPLPPEIINLLFLIIFILVINAFVTSTASSVIGRLQSRISCAVVFVFLSSGLALLLNSARKTE